MINALSQIYDLQLFSPFYGCLFIILMGVGREEPSLSEYKAGLVGVGQVEEQVLVQMPQTLTVLTEVWQSLLNKCFSIYNYALRTISRNLK